MAERKSGWGVWLGTAAGMAMVAAALLPQPGFAQTFRNVRTFGLTGMTTDATALLALADVASPELGPDGILDIVAAAQNSRAAVLAGFGDGGFTSAPTTMLGRIPTGMAVGKVNGDDLFDLVFVDSSSELTVFLGHPDGPPFDMVAGDLPVGRNPVAVALADLNKDSKLDALVLSEGLQGSGEVTILRGNGDGTFAAPPAPASASVESGVGAAAIVVRDFNRDGNLDFAVANSIGGDVQIVLSDSQGRFEEVQTIAIGAQQGAQAEPIAIDAASLNGDQIVDLVVVNRNTDQLAVLNGRNNGQFDNPRYFVSGSSGSTPTSIALGDMNLDQKIDAVVANNRSNDVSVLLGDGAGNFGRPRAFVADLETLAVVIGDLNDDEIPDVVAANKGSEGPSAAVLLGDGTGALAAIEDVPTDPTPLDMVTGDFNNDGLCDLGFLHSSGRVLLFRSQGAEGFAPLLDTPLTLGSDGVALAAADFNRDGWLDVASADKATGMVLVALRRPGGGFQRTPDYDVGAGSASLLAADFNGDRLPDLAVAQQAGDEGDGAVKILLNTGNGRFATPVRYAVGETPITMDVGDFDNNGRLDLLVGNNVSEDVSILVGNGNGTFQEGRFVSVSGGPRDLAVADFDRDGCSDFATTLPMARQTAVFYGNCQNGFTRGQQGLSSSDSPAAVAARDVSGDGIPDAMSGDQVGNSVSVYIKRAGDRFFTHNSADTYTVSRRPIAVASGDFDGDGRYDMASMNSFVAGSGSVLTNITAPARLRGDGNGDTRVTAADLVSVMREVGDADGDRIEEVGASTYAAAPGVDANGDGAVNSQDAYAVAAWTFPRL